MHPTKNIKFLELGSSKILSGREVPLNYLQKSPSEMIFRLKPIERLMSENDGASDDMMLCAIRES